MLMCNEPGCLNEAETGRGFRKCEQHGQIARQRNIYDKERWAQETAQRAQDRLAELAEMFNVDVDAMEALVSYVRGEE